jgi:hypothetical protein
MPRRSPRETDLYQRLGPSRFSGQGFLGEDPREWEEILAADARALDELGISREQLLQALRAVYDQARDRGGDPVELGGSVQAECLECRGAIPSPFSGEGTFPKHQVVVRDSREGETFTITPLGLHLIEKHGFFQGVGSPFRINPTVAVRVLGLEAPGPGTAG